MIKKVLCSLIIDFHFGTDLSYKGVTNQHKVVFSLTFIGPTNVDGFQF